MREIVAGNFKDFSLLAVFSGDRRAPHDETLTNNYTIYVSRYGHQMEFDYWPDDLAMENEFDVIVAFADFLVDVYCGSMGFIDFMDEMDTDDWRTGYKVWQECRAAAEKFKRVFNGDIDELGNEIVEWIEEHAEGLV